MIKILFIALTSLLFSGCFSFLPYQTEFSFDTTAYGSVDKNALGNHKESLEEVNNNENKESKPIQGIYEVKFFNSQKQLINKTNELDKCKKKEQVNTCMQY